MKKFFTIIIILIAAGVLYYGNTEPAQSTDEPQWNISFSHVFAQSLGIPWEQVYGEILSDLKPQRIRLPVYWSLVERSEGEYDFSDYDFMLEEAKQHGTDIVLVVGRRVPRWPECHIPDWAKSLSYEEQNKRLKNFIIAVVERYKKHGEVSSWQVENEPFLPLFGECPPPDGAILDEEIRLVKFLDDSRPIIVTDSGELSMWFPAYRRGDIFGTTMYRSVWSSHISPYIGYITYPLPPRFFWLKANLMRMFFGEKKIIVSELQAEPWAPGLLKNLSLEEQDKTFNLQKFYENIEYAREAGFPEVYLWGVEWWYFMKEEYNHPEFWETGKEVISQNK